MTTKKEIVDLETGFWNAIRDEDPDAAIALMTDPSTISGAHGAMAVSHAQYTSMAEGSMWKLHSFAMDKIDVRFPTDDVAIIGYIVDEDVTVDGKRMKLQAAESSTWVRKDKTWLCASHSEAILGDPFGRDRQPTKKAA